MNIDWKELDAGVSAELEKSGVDIGRLARPVINAAKNIAPKVNPKTVAVGAAGLAGASKLHQMGQAVSDGMGGMLNSWLPFAALSNRSMGLGQAAATPMRRLKPTSIFNVAPGEVHSLAENQFAVGQPGIVVGDPGMLAKSASDIISDSVSRVLQQRLGSNIIDSVYSGKQHEGLPHTKEKELEITSKYPEMAKLLEDEQNKAYLAKLLSEQA
jgi:hypothetical protein